MKFPGLSPARAPLPRWTEVISRLLVIGAVITGVLSVVMGTAAPIARSAPQARSQPTVAAERPGLHPDTRASHREAGRKPVRASRVVSHGGSRIGSLTTPRLEDLSYIVRPGDTLSAIAQRFGGPSAGWQWLWAANRPRISDPDLIHPGQLLAIPDKPGGPAVSTASGTHPVYRTQAVLIGTLGCAGLEALWERAGGAPARSVIAASIAMAESSGNQYATGPAGERGYWQIHPDHGALSTYDPYGNARAAISLSADGTNWSPWTTYTSGAYTGRC